jgi:uncharacterized membrane protein YhiD involved in acid resistance
VTQVIGDNVARAFSLVGALSIVRFRTVVRDTQDTAFVIFAVAVGMAAGAGAPWVAVLGLAVVAAAAFAMRPSVVAASPARRYTLIVRTALGLDLDATLGPALDTHLEGRQLRGIETARQGASLEVAYDAVLKAATVPGDFVKRLHRIEGVQAVELRRPLVVDD